MKDEDEDGLQLSIYIPSYSGYRSFLRGDYLPTSPNLRGGGNSLMYRSSTRARVTKENQRAPSSDSPPGRDKDPQKKTVSFVWLKIGIPRTGLSILKLSIALESVTNFFFSGAYRIVVSQPELTKMDCVYVAIFF